MGAPAAGGAGRRDGPLSSRTGGGPRGGPLRGRAGRTALCDTPDDDVEAGAKQLTKDPVMDDGFLAITSLSRAMGGRAQLPDVGSMLWVILRQIVPCDAMVLFLPDAGREHVVAGYAAGAHAARPRRPLPPAASGIPGGAP